MTETSWHPAGSTVTETGWHPAGSTVTETDWRTAGSTVDCGSLLPLCGWRSLLRAVGEDSRS